jgi:prepilin-type N-terminal cleavage/methylation domain-containing protein
MWRFGEAAPLVGEHGSSPRVASRPKFWGRLIMAHRARRRAPEGGFTLIELVIVVAVMPIVIGALSLGILSVFSLQTSVSNRLTDSGDAQLVSLNFQNDVQSASLVTTAASPISAPASCGTGVQVLGLQLGNGTQIAYTAAAASSGKTYDLWRNLCNGASPPTSVVMSRDIPESQVPGSPTYDAATATPFVTVSCASSSSACAVVPPSGDLAYTLDWVSTVGITGVTFNATEPGSKFNYSVVATPLSASSSSQLASTAPPSTGCGFATLGTGTYSQTLCFADFSPWNTQTAATGTYDCDAAKSGFSTPLPMAAQITGSPFTLDFCMSVSAFQPAVPPATQPTSLTGPTSAGPNCGVAARSGYDDITASPLPTYACPPGSEAFLGNNGFYTGVPGEPALYEVNNGSDATINFTNIALFNSNGSAATNWQLVTGDAESTDPNESITWSTNNSLVPLNLLANSSTSAVGNACNSTPPGYTSTSPGLTGIGTSTVVCSTANSTDKTGTAMLKALTPSSLTVTLDGGGLQAMFMGVLLQAGS